MNETSVRVWPYQNDRRIDGKAAEIKFNRYERRIVAPVIERYEMTSISHSPRDRILWILVNNGGTMGRAD